MMWIFHYVDTLALHMPSRKRLIIVKFNHRDTFARSQVSQDKKHNIKTSKISVYLCDKYSIPRKDYHAFKRLSRKKS